MSTTDIGYWHKSTCNKVLQHLCKNAKNIAAIEIETGTETQTSASIQRHLDECLGYLKVKRLIVETSERGYKITEEGKRFYKNGGFS